MILLQEVLALHRRLVELHLCMDGIRDFNLLQSAVVGQQWYQNIFDMYVHVAYSINASHLFSDGNKRTCFLVIKELNKFRYYFNDDSLTTEILNLAKHTVSEQEFRARVCNCII